jgi:hypothetical protein
MAHLGSFGTAVAVALLGICPTVVGCGSGPQTSELLDNQLRDFKATRQPTGKFAGTVTIDGKPPRDAITEGLRIMLYDPTKPSPVNSAPLNAIVNHDDGRFEFTTYSEHDGAPQGSYIVLFVALKHTFLGRHTGYHEPDELKNLYNDPDKNGMNAEFQVEITSGGQADYHFDLALEGKEPAASPAPKAITRFQ